MVRKRYHFACGGPSKYVGVNLGFRVSLKNVHFGESVGQLALLTLASTFSLKLMKSSNFAKPKKRWKETAFHFVI